MNIKVQCSCGAKFSFDVEPIGGQMPCAIACPQCGADATAAANQVLSQKVSSAPLPAGPPTSSLRVASVATPPPAPVAAQPVPQSSPAAQMCTRHPRKRVESHCYVCSKPICMDCMQIFGYLCSATCRYQAEQQGIQIPACEFKKSVAEAKDWRKVGAIIGGIVALLLVLVAFGVWFKFSGSHPKVYYSVKAAKEGWYTHAQFLDPKHVLVADEKAISLHDVDEKKVLWTRTFEKGSDVDMTERPTFFPSTNSIWVCLANAALRLDLKTGEILNTIPLKGMPTNVRQEGNEMVVHSNAGETKDIVTRIAMGTGEAKTEELILTPIPKTIQKRDLSKADPTQGVLLEEELNESTVVGRERSQFIPAGANLVEFQVRMIESHFNEVQSIKPNKGPSKIDSNISASTPVAPVAEEIFNDIARSRGGGYKTVDESRYGVTLHRSEKDVPDWKGEVIGPPAFFPLQTVDVLTAGKGIWIFDKQNKLLKQDKLAFPISEDFGFTFSHRAPCVELDGALYFFDQGILTAFDLPGGDVRWRLPSVGISQVQSDKKGSLYVCTTTASPEDIQYSDQVKLQDPSVSILMKVEARTGKILWKARHLGTGCYITDKYVYASNLAIGGGPSLAIGLSQALGSRGGGGTARFRLSRLDPSTGKQLWDYFMEGNPDQLDFSKNRILLQTEEKVVVLKFLSF